MKSCVICVLKHLATAEALWTESKLGYPIHRYLAIGQMACAEAESLQWPGLAASIRDQRTSMLTDDNYEPDLLILIKLAHDFKLEEAKKTRRK